MGHARHLLAEDPGRAIIRLDEVLAWYLITRPLYC